MLGVDVPWVTAAVAALIILVDTRVLRWLGKVVPELLSCLAPTVFGWLQYVTGNQVWIR